MVTQGWYRVVGVVLFVFLPGIWAGVWRHLDDHFVSAVTEPGMGAYNENFPPQAVSG